MRGEEKKSNLEDTNITWFCGKGTAKKSAREGKFRKHAKREENDVEDRGGEDSFKKQDFTV